MGRGRSGFRLLFRGAISAVLIAVVVRLLDVMVSRHRRNDSIRSKDLERDKEMREAYEAEQIELDASVLPGISIRS